MRAPDQPAGSSSPAELRAVVERYLDDLALTPELGGLEEGIRYSLAGGGKRKIGRASCRERV